MFWDQVRLMRLGGSGLGDFPSRNPVSARAVPASHEGYPQRVSWVLTALPGKLLLRLRRRSLNSPLGMLAPRRRSRWARYENRDSCSAEAQLLAGAVQRMRCSGSTRTALKLARMRSRAPRGEFPQIFSRKAASCCLRNPAPGARRHSGAGGVQGEIGLR